MSQFPLRRALDNYRRQRHRLAGGHYPHLACQCAFCETIRAADLLFNSAEAHVESQRWMDRPPPDPTRRMRN